jgi:DNA-directed RNA polymerase subunit omega (EC 2.7.7.6)
MARITSQKAAQMIGSQFDLVLVAAQRARELRSGIKPLIDTKNDSCITALKEIELGLYTRQDYITSLKHTKRTTRR